MEIYSSASRKHKELIKASTNNHSSINLPDTLCSSIYSCSDSFIDYQNSCRSVFLSISCFGRKHQIFSHMRTCCLFFSYMIENEIFLGFGQNEQFKDDTLLFHSLISRENNSNDEINHEFQPNVYSIKCQKEVNSKSSRLRG